MKKGRVNAKYEEKYLRANRTFPKANTVWLIILVIIQILLILFAIFFKPKPQDTIREYHVTVQPLDDGSLDITYTLLWEPLDEDEPLTWVEIGMANPNYSVYKDSLTSNISYFTQEVYEDNQCYTELHFKRAYKAGEVFEFSFKVNQRNMLCLDRKGYFYEFVPCWFNSTPVQHYEFRWIGGNMLTGGNNDSLNDFDLIWTGRLECGEYRSMNVRYAQSAFSECNIVAYAPFDPSGAWNELNDSKAVVVVIVIIVILLIVVAQVNIIDSYVSYYRGRGFLHGYGYHVHTYGRRNPWYTREAEKHAASHSGGHHSGGCACACACACAGGGRAGCSQKDTTELIDQ